MSIPGFPYPHSIVTTNGAAASTPIPVAIRADDTLIAAVEHPGGNGAPTPVALTTFTVADGSVETTVDTSGNKLLLVWINEPEGG